MVSALFDMILQHYLFCSSECFVTEYVDLLIKLLSKSRAKKKSANLWLMCLGLTFEDLVHVVILKHFFLSFMFIMMRKVIEAFLVNLYLQTCHSCCFFFVFF